MWGRQLLVISIPMVLAWLSFGKIPLLQLFFFQIDSSGALSGTSLAMIGALVEPSAALRFPGASRSWYFSLSTAAYSASLGVNAIVATLLAVRISQVQRMAEKSFTVQKHKIHPIRGFISIINDSGMLMLGCQIIWLTLFRLNSVGFVLVRGPIVMIYVRIKDDPPFVLLLNMYSL